MKIDNRALIPDGPRERVTNILKEVLGTEVDLSSDEGRATAIRTLDDRQIVGIKPEVPPPSAFDDISPDDTRTAWEVARGFCAELQLDAALKILDKLKPLSDRDDYALYDDATEDFNGLKSQINAELLGLRDELKHDADGEALSNSFQTLLGSSNGLFDELRAAGNYSGKHVVTRKDERVVTDYLMIRAFVGELCAFPINCDKPASEPESAGTSLGKSLSVLTGQIRCIRETTGDIRDELSNLGVSEECTPISIPGVEFESSQIDEPDDPDSKGKSKAVQRREYQSAPKKPSVADLFAHLRRSESKADIWINGLAMHGKNGAANIRSEIDRLSIKAGNFKPKIDDDETPKVAYLLNLYVTKFDDASAELQKLLP